MTLPKLDLSLFKNGNATEREKLAADLLSSFRLHGFVKLVGHGVSPEMVAKLFDMNQKFFKMPMHDKSAIANIRGPNPQRGWSKTGEENSATLYQKGFLGKEAVADLSDAREHWDQGAKTDTQFPNKWPEEDSLPGFRTTMEAAFETLEGVAATIMEALEHALGLPHGVFLDKITHEQNASELRFNHYPAIGVEELRRGHISRIWPHFDLGVITLLFQDRVGGLEFEDRENRGAFKSIECGSPSDMVVNISETLQRWTNDLVPAGLHRVTLPTDIAETNNGTLPDRYSIAYFCKADRTAPAGSLETFVAEGHAPSYKPMTAIEFHQQRLLSAY